MKMESAVEAQQGVETAVNETESQQITPAQIATLAQVTVDDYRRKTEHIEKAVLCMLENTKLASVKIN